MFVLENKTEIANQCLQCEVWCNSDPRCLFSSHLQPINVRGRNDRDKHEGKRWWKHTQSRRETWWDEGQGFYFWHLRKYNEWFSAFVRSNIFLQ